MRSKLVAGVAAFVLGTVCAGYGAPKAAAQTDELTVEEIEELPTLERGDRGSAVATWQGRLNEWLQIERTEQGRLSVDGIFGARTEAATRDFQRAQEIPVDGIVGPVTRSAFLSAPALAAEEPDPAAGGPLLLHGNRGQDVAEWQEGLNEWLQVNRPEQGRLAVDGVFGERTEAATRDFQRAQGITVDGLVGPETRAALRSAPSLVRAGEQGAERPLLSRGDRGPAVERWQDRLNDWLQIERTEMGRLATDGSFGSKTEAATRDFQSAQGISVDGIVGPETRGALEEALSDIT